MTRILDSAKKVIAEQTTARIAHLVRIEQPGHVGVFKYLTDYGRNIEYLGNIYNTNSIKSIGNVKQTKLLNNYQVNITISGTVEDEFEAALSSESLIDRRITIYKAFLDNNDRIIPMRADGTTIKYFEGSISTVGTRDNANTSGIGSSTISWSCASSLQDFQAVNGRLTDDEAHRGLVNVNGVLTPSTAALRPEYQQDKGFAHANKSISILASYQTKEKRFKMTSRRAHGFSGLIGGRSYDMEEYWATVTKEVDMNINLTAKYIPTVYGVQKVPGIPIFVDTSKDNPDEVWAVYAFAEGEIDGFLDFYMDDAPIICVDDIIDPEKRVCLGEKRNRGDTISFAIGSPVKPTSPSIHGEHYIFDDGAGKTHFWTYHGKEDQTASQVLVDLAAANGFKLQGNIGSSYWDADYKLLDTAYAVIKFTLNADKTTIPQISAEIQGRKVKIYKEDGSVTQSSTSLNFTWQALDYLTNEVFGARVPFNLVDLPSFLKVAKLQDIIDPSYLPSWVPFWRYIGWTDKGAENRQMMQGSALFKGSDTVFKNLDTILQQFDASLNIVGGIYTISCEAESPSVADLRYEDFVEGKIDTSDNTAKEKNNSVQASITDPAKGWGTNSITFYNADYKKQDKNKDIKANIVFPYITNYYTARSRAERVLKRSRLTKRVTFSLTFEYFWLYPNAPITLTSSRHKWDKKKFLIEDVEWLSNGKVKITAREYTDDIFINSTQSDNSSNQIPDIDVAVLPPRDLQYTPDTDNIIEGLNGTLSWLPSLTRNVSYYTIKWTGQVQTQTLAITGKEPADQRLLFPLFNMPEGLTTFEVRAANFGGITSKPAVITFDMNSTRNLPSVTGFRCTNLSPTMPNVFIGANLNLTWDAMDLPDVIGLGYNLQIMNDSGDLLKEVTIHTGNTFSFTLKDNKDSYRGLYTTIGIFRDLKAQIKAIGASGESSVQWAKL